jgi:PAP2 superfamily
MPSALRPSLLVEGLIVAWLAWLYDVVTNLAPVRAHAALGHGWAIWHAERATGLDPELALNHWLAAHHTLGQLASYYYDNAHFVITIGLLVWLWLRHPRDYRPLRSALVLVNLIGFAVFWLYPVAPPRMLAGTGFFDVVGHSGTFGQWHTGSLASSADQFAAMPSLHIAWALWCAVVLWRSAPAPGRLRVLVRSIAVLYPCLTTADVFATGNHYLFDVLAGAATLPLALLLASVLGATAGRLWAVRTTRP